MDKSFNGLRRVIGEEDKAIQQDPVGTGSAMLRKGPGSRADQAGVSAGEDGGAQRGKKRLRG